MFKGKNKAQSVRYQVRYLFTLLRTPKKKKKGKK